MQNMRVKVKNQANGFTQKDETQYNKAPPLVVGKRDNFIMGKYGNHEGRASFEPSDNTWATGISFRVTHRTILCLAKEHTNFCMCCVLYIPSKPFQVRG